MTMRRSSRKKKKRKETLRDFTESIVYFQLRLIFENYFYSVLKYQGKTNCKWMQMCLFKLSVHILFSAMVCVKSCLPWPRSLLKKTLPSRKIEIYLWKIATKLEMFCRVTLAKLIPPAMSGPDGRILLALGTNQIPEFVEYRPLTNLEKKMNKDCRLLIFEKRLFFNYFFSLSFIVESLFHLYKVYSLIRIHEKYTENEGFW